MTYEADFYARFNPQTALDIIARTPGFSLASGEAVHGFGGAASNVLVDGRRPTVKTGGIEEVLQRITASQVERVELLRGSQVADAQGFTRIANIILKAGSELSGTASVEMRRAPIESGLTPRAELNFSGPIAGWQASASVVAYRERNPMRGRYDLFDANGILTDALAKQQAATSSGVTLTGAASRALGGGTLSLNGKLDRQVEDYGQILVPFLGPPVEA